MNFGIQRRPGTNPRQTLRDDYIEYKKPLIIRCIPISEITVYKK
jgi:hypothetical protein